MKLSSLAKLSLATAIFLWSSAFVGIRAALSSYSPGGLALLRFVIASFCMYFLNQVFATKMTKPKDQLYMMLVGAICVGGYAICLNYGEITVPAGIASFIVSQSPIIGTILAAIFLKEHIHRLGILGIGISLFGVILILFSNGIEDFALNIGWFYIFLATVLSALYSILQKKFLNQCDLLEVTTYAIWGGTLALLFFIPDTINDLKHATWRDTLIVLYLGIFPAAIAYVAWNYALSELSVARTVNFLYLMPLIATLLGWLCLGESPTLLSIIGGLIALVGVWVVNKSFHFEKLQKNIDI